MINNVTLIGRLVKDVELRATQSGKFVGSFTIAVNGFKEGEADFINCVVWEKKAEALANYTSKGSKIGVSGQLKTRSYDTDGGRRFVTEVLVDQVEFMDKAKTQTHEGGLITENQFKENTTI